MPHSALSLHSDLCDEVYQVLIDENHLLKLGSEITDNEFLTKKSNLISKIESSTQNLRSMNALTNKEGLHKNILLSSLKKKMIKIFLLIKENEQLALKINSHLHHQDLNFSNQKEKLTKIYAQS